jgi:hypothetical protein
VRRLRHNKLSVDCPLGTPKIKIKNVIAPININWTSVFVPVVYATATELPVACTRLYAMGSYVAVAYTLYATGSFVSVT